jgi:hypothetical protein
MEAENVNTEKQISKRTWSSLPARQWLFSVVGLSLDAAVEATSFLAPSGVFPLSPLPEPAEVFAAAGEGFLA